MVLASWRWQVRGVKLQPNTEYATTMNQSWILGAILPYSVPSGWSSDGIQALCPEDNYSTIT